MRCLLCQSRSLDFNAILPRSLALAQGSLPKSCPFGNLHLSPGHHSRTSGSLFCLTALEPQSINWQMTSNRRAHNTHNFYDQELILRRGQAFNFLLSLNRNLSSGERLGFIASTGTGFPPLHTHLRRPWSCASKGWWW